MLRFIIAKWGASKHWWRRQCTAAVALGFVSIMRLGEVCGIRRAGVRITFHDGSEAPMGSMCNLPKAAEVAGMLFHLPWRKNHGATDCWVPVACSKTVSLILKQSATLRKRRCASEYLFPARRFAKGNKQRMHQSNRVGAQSMVTALRRALMQCVPLMTARWKKLYSGHSLRVGGSNHMRKMGVADEVHRRLGGWMSLVSAQGYMALSAREQYHYTLKLAKKKTRRSGMSKSRARTVLGVLQPGML